MQFAPTSCEVVNVSNEEEVYPLWDLTEEMMCDENNPHPVNFEVYSVPETTQFYGLTYQGMIMSQYSYRQLVTALSLEQLSRCSVS